MTARPPHHLPTVAARRAPGRTARRAVWLAGALSLLVPAARADAAGGSLDPGFGGTGFVITAVGPGDQRAHAMALAPDGKVLVAGMAEAGAYWDTIVVRYNADGTLDPSFDGDGKVVNSFSVRTDRAGAVAVQPDGKVVVAGDLYDTGPGSSRIYVARYTTAGKLDTTFAGTGLRTVTLPGSTGGAGYAIRILADGRIVVAGMAGYDTAVLRLKSDGSYDTTLGGDGLVTISTGASVDYATSLVVLGDGRMVLAGSTNAGIGSKIAVARLQADGTPDATFNTTGVATTAIAGTTFGNALVVQPDGKMVVAGRTGDVFNPVVVRYNPDGSLDTTFKGTGILRLTDREFDSFEALALQSDGHLLAVGRSSTPVPGEASVTRIEPGGLVDTAFGADGTVRVHNPAISSLGSAGTVGLLQPDGKLLIAGRHTSGLDDDDLLVARLDVTPIVVPPLPPPVSVNPDVATGLTVTGPSRILDTRSGSKPAGASFVKVATGAPSGATAALVNLTMTLADAAGFVSADRCGAFAPGVVPGKSNGNFVAGVDVANLNVVPIDADGSFCLYTSAPAHLIVDLQGTYGPGGMLFTPTAPNRVLDTRAGSKPAAGAPIEVASGAPAGAKAVLVNLTMTRADAAGYVTADRCSAFAGGTPSSSNGNFIPAADVANGTVVPVDADGSFCLVTSAPADLIVDVQGSYRDGAGLSLEIGDPVRVLDTRSGPKPAAGSITKVATGAPAGTTSVFVNLTMTRAEGAGYVTADRCSTLADPPGNSNGNFRPGVDIANSTVVPVDTDGSFCLYTSASADLIVDLQGTY